MAETDKHRDDRRYRQGRGAGRERRYYPGHPTASLVGPSRTSAPDDGCVRLAPGFAARLVDMAPGRLRWASPTTANRSFPDRQPHLALLLRGGRTSGLRADLAALLPADTGAAAGGRALTDATLILEGIAATSTPERAAPAGSPSTTARCTSTPGTRRATSHPHHRRAVELTDTALRGSCSTKTDLPMTEPGRAGKPWRG